MIPNSEQLFTERRLEAHVLCALDRQPVHCVVVHLKDASSRSMLILSSLTLYWEIG